MKKTSLISVVALMAYCAATAQSVKCGNAAADSDAVNNVYAGANMQGVQNVLLDVNHSHPYWCDTVGGAGTSNIATAYDISGAGDSLSGTSGYLLRFNTSGKSAGNSDIYNKGMYNSIGNTTLTNRLSLWCTDNQGFAVYDSAHNQRVVNMFTSGDAGYLSLNNQYGTVIELNGSGGIQTASDVYVGLLGSGGNLYVYGNVALKNAGNVLEIKNGTNASTGKDTLTAGTDTVHTTVVQATSEVFVTLTSDAAGSQAIYVSAISAGNYLVIKSSAATSADRFNWLIINQP